MASSNFDKRYLDYRRNANGIVDTIGVDEKIVQELETDDAVCKAFRPKSAQRPKPAGAQ